MNEYRIKQLTLRNFKGVVDFVLHVGGDDCVIRGDNATGKTTVRDAVFWLLTGKDSAGRANFEVKTLKENGQPTHGLEHEVEAVFIHRTGGLLALRRTYREDWRKKRGLAEREFSGHSTDYIVDDVPVQKKEFDAVVSSALAPERVLRLLMDPEYFSDTLAWKDRRALLLDVCGNVTDDDVIDSTPALADLRALLDGVTPEAVRAAGGDCCDALRRKLAAAKRKTNDKLTQVPVRIDEKQRELAQFADVDQVGALPARERQVEEELVALDEQLLQHSFGGAVAEARKRLSNAESARQEAETKARGAHDAKVRQAYEKLVEALAAADQTNRELTTARVAVESARTRLEAAAARIDEFEVQRVAVEVAVPTVADDPIFGPTCPTCGQSIDEALTDEARAKFNTQQAERLRRIDTELNREREELASLKKSLDDGEQRVRAAESAAEASSRDVAEKREAHDLATASTIILSGELRQEVDAAAEALAAARGSGEDERSAIQAQVDILRAARRDIRRTLAQEELRAGIEQRISALRKEQQQLAGQQEEYERQLFLTEEFVRRKVALLEDRINERFTIAKFKLFREQVQGGLEECCETTVGGVPYGTNLNHGARVAVGLEIISVLQEHFELRLPVIVDQAESVTTLPPMACQMIRLVVDAEAHELTVCEAAA